MSRDPLRFYPRAWRERYGDEMRALIEDDLDGFTPSRRYRARLAFAGLRECARASGVVGDSPSTARRWAGSSIVLYSWAALCAAGGSFAKSAEHFRSALAPWERAAPSVAYAVVLAAASAGALFIAAGAAVALPGVVAAARAGRVTLITRTLWIAVGATVVVVAGTAGIALWAHQLSAAQRNGSDGVYSAAVLAWALGGVGALALWARVATRVARAALSDRVMRIESWLAVGVWATSAVVTASSIWWWADMAERAPAFLTWGSDASTISGRAVATLGLMALAVTSASVGVARIASARR